MNATARRRVLLFSLSAGLIFGLLSCMHDQPQIMEIQLTSVFAAPTEVPGDLAWDGQALWVVDFMEASIKRINVASGALLSSVPLPTSDLWASGIAWDGEALWVHIVLSPSLIRIDPASGQTLREIPLLIEEEPLSLAWDGETLWILTRTALTRVDPQTGEILKQLPLPGGEVTAVAWDGQRLLVTERSILLLIALSPLDGHALASWPLPDSILSPVGLAWDGRTLWLSEEVDGTIYQIRLPQDIR